MLKGVKKMRLGTMKRNNFIEFQSKYDNGNLKRSRNFE